MNKCLYCTFIVELSKLYYYDTLTCSTYRRKNVIIKTQPSTFFFYFSPQNAFLISLDNEWFFISPQKIPVFYFFQNNGNFFISFQITDDFHSSQTTAVVIAPHAIAVLFKFPETTANSYLLFFLKQKLFLFFHTTMTFPSSLAHTTLFSTSLQTAAPQKTAVLYSSSKNSYFHFCPLFFIPTQKTALFSPQRTVVFISPQITDVF